MKRLIVVDGNSLLFRAYYATSYGGSDTILRTSEGIPTNGVLAFANMINALLRNMKKGDHILVGFDTGSKTFRHDALDSYKAQRKPIDQDLITQLPIARELLESLNIKHYEQVGVEGDDICGTIAKMGLNHDLKVEIYTSDKDFLQLIQNNL